MVNKIVARVVSVHAGSNEDLSKEEHPTVQVELDGVVGVVEAAGPISAGDEVTVEVYESPAWLKRS